MKKINQHHYNSAIIGMWRMGATIEQIRDNTELTTYHIQQIIEYYAATQQYINLIR
jgi:uncharacterized protein (DUF433 family)